MSEGKARKDHKVSSPIPDNCHLFRVANLLDSNQRQWSHYKMSSLFSPSEINAISFIPIGGPNVKDELVWPFSKNGEYSVKLIVMLRLILSQNKQVSYVARDNSGRLVGGNSLLFSALSASVAEATAIRLDTIFALNVGWHKIILESDNRGLISRINSKSFSAWESAAVEEDIVSLTASFPLFSFCFVFRSCNKIANWIAKACLKGICPLDWQVNPPPQLRRLLVVSQ
ncbi:hypothetical protein GQ457_06G027680 [Hibiscus cannabinus]